MYGKHTISWDDLQRAHEATYMPGGDPRMLDGLIDQRKKYLNSTPEDLAAKIWNSATPALAADRVDHPTSCFVT